MIKPEPLKGKRIRIGQKGKPMIDFESDLLVELNYSGIEKEVLFKKIDNAFEDIQDITSSDGKEVEDYIVTQLKKGKNII